jgi:S-adenosylmethionine-diacylgycerolhomoserine-N-methlytransferase
MNNTSSEPNPDLLEQQPANIRQYYRFHAAIYDATRWTFLLGRNAILKKIGLTRDFAGTLLEVGCGTGRNLRRLAQAYPALRLVGVDVSADMLERASKATDPYSRRVLLFEQPYAPDTFKLQEPVDVVLISYALTMFNPGWEMAIARALHDLKPGGRIAIVDFHDSPSSAFRWWMGQNHVRMEAHLLPLLQEHFQTEYLSIRSAYFGLWRYCLFVGKKP